MEELGGREDKDQNHIVCDYCGKEFDNSDKFKIHIDQVHSSSDSFHEIKVILIYPSYKERLLILDDGLVQSLMLL